MSDHTGAIIWKAEYKAWGECRTEKAKSNFFENSEIISNNIRFQGQYFDQETGLHYNRHRYYSPYVGRFIFKDPIGLLGGHNVYAYAPNPIDWVDPRGLARVKGSKGSSGKGGGVSSKKKPCPGNPCEGQNPSASARSWQGKDPYPGKDSYKNVVLKKGTILYTLHPHGRDENPLKNPTPNYFGKTQQVLKMQGKGARAYNDALQLSHDENTPGSRYKVRKQLHQFVVTQDICIAQGFAKENPHLGTGGEQQIFVMNKDKNYLEATGKLFNLE